MQSKRWPYRIMNSKRQTCTSLYSKGGKCRSLYSKGGFVGVCTVRLVHERVFTVKQRHVGDRTVREGK